MTCDKSPDFESYTPHCEQRTHVIIIVMLKINLINLAIFPDLRWGWVYPERAQILNGIQFTRHFIVETKQFVGTNVNVILMQQTCGQRSNRAAGSKRPALQIFVSERIWISKCRRD